MKKILEKINKLSLSATILVASLILGGFYFANQANKQRSLDNCLSEARINYRNAWDRECEKLGELISECLNIGDSSLYWCTYKHNLTEEAYRLMQREGFCRRLPSHTANTLKDYQDRRIDTCFKRYPQK